MNTGDHQTDVATSVRPDLEKYDQNFNNFYFEIKEDNARDTKWSSLVEVIGGEYWRIVEHPTDEVNIIIY
ncbi:unnamed protein product [Brassica rapa]|nr:unnamed protein product [Brassica napus]CAG7860974.1 unnamed protein product [Brassica rapa]CDY49198.1 BnaA09g10800D [Brassica napus]VDC59386.1 unnamed protein product [Brassica rapa]